MMCPQDMVTSCRVFDLAIALAYVCQNKASTAAVLDAARSVRAPGRRAGEQGEGQGGSGRWGRQGHGQRGRGGREQGSDPAPLDRHVGPSPFARRSSRDSPARPDSRQPSGRRFPCASPRDSCSPWCPVPTRCAAAPPRQLHCPCPAPALGCAPRPPPRPAPCTPFLLVVTLSLSLPLAPQISLHPENRAYLSLNAGPGAPPLAPANAAQHCCPFLLLCLVSQPRHKCGLCACSAARQGGGYWPNGRK